MKLISCKEAASQGRKYYFTGKPCTRGHVCKRAVSDRSCMGCKRITDVRRYRNNRREEQARSRAYQRVKLPEPTRPCPVVCELCGSPPGKRVLHLDHDHRTGKFRGWLCQMCNLSLGKFGDNAQGLARALAYLDKNTGSLLPDGNVERKSIPLASGCSDYFASALIEVARLSWAGNEKHNPGEPMHDARDKSQDDSDCLLRHFSERGKWDVIVTADGRHIPVRHSAAVAWRALRILQKEMEAAGAPLAPGARL